MDTEVHLDERKRVKREEQLSPTFSTPAPPLTIPPFSPFVDYLLNLFIYNLSRPYIIVAKFLRTKQKKNTIS
jgi:hypothetical protein